MSYMPKNPKPLEELELFELFVALYPEKFAAREAAGEDLWDEVMEFVDEVTAEEGGDNPVKDLLARIVYLAPLMESPLSGNVSHALGKPFGTKGGFVCAVQRPQEAPSPVPAECKVGMHSWVDDPSITSGNCKHCGEAYGDPE